MALNRPQHCEHCKHRNHNGTCRIAVYTPKKHECGCVVIDVDEGAVGVLDFRYAAKKIAWQRQMERNAARERILSAIYWRLSEFTPNTILNIRHPWKRSERFTLRAWCPLHNGHWAKLIVKADEAGHVTYDCARGCASDEVEHFLNQTTRVPLVSFADANAPAPIVRADDAAGMVCDAQHLFGCHRQLEQSRFLTTIQQREKDGQF